MPREIIDTQASRGRYQRRFAWTIAVLVLAVVLVVAIILVLARPRAGTQVGVAYPGNRAILVPLYSARSLQEN